MTSSKRELRLDQTLDDILGDGSGTIPVDYDPELLGLLPVARDVQAVLANTPPPPHGLRPGRSVFLTAVANPPAAKRSRFSLPAFGRTLSWLAPTVAVLLFALLLTGLFQKNIFPAAIGSSILPELTPTQTQSPTLTPRTSSPPTTPLTAPPTKVSTKKPPVAPHQTSRPAVEQDIPSGLTGRESPTATASPSATPTAETPQPDSTDATRIESTPTPLPDTQPTPTSITTPSSSTSTPNPSQTPTETPTTTPTLSATPTPSKPATLTPTSTPPKVITPPASLTPHPIPLTKTPPPRPTSTPTPTPPAPTQTPNISTITPQVILPTATITHSSSSALPQRRPRTRVLTRR